LEWSKQKDRKPLLLRGARQVGKTSAVRHLSKQFDNFIEVNFEEQKQVHRIFESDLNPKEICENLSVLFNISIKAGKTLLFFDEIQSCIPAISSLRFFYEKYPELHVIAAGSLLEFAIEELPSFAVGRLRSFFMYPFSFDEYLLAIGEDKLLELKQKASVGKPIVDPVHNKILIYLKRFLILGGMPEVIAKYVYSDNLLECQKVLDDLIISLKADFTKYKKRVPSMLIQEVFDSVVQQTGNKFVYSATSGINQRLVKEALDLLIKAGLVIPVTHTSANGLPLGAETNIKKRKMLLLDTGIHQRLLGLNISDVLLADTFELINKGNIAELFVGLEILKSGSCQNYQDLYYWQREALNSNAEVDYIIQKSQNIIPIEVKSGKKGSMKSMHLFLNEKKKNIGYRFSLEKHAVYDNIKVLPLYSVSENV
jgi:predicted AAA+ superfamily ATPase